LEEGGAVEEREKGGYGAEEEDVGLLSGGSKAESESVEAAG
jgi:hypothetical protein